MKNNVYLYDCKIYSYDNSKEFYPCDKYPELKDNNLPIASDPKIYDCMRNLFINMGLDKKNIGTPKWNPFSDFIKKGDKVLIKPNLVKHINKLPGGSIDAVITNFSIIRPIIDYTILALNNTGKIIVGDSPVQECIFEEVININNLKQSILKYQTIYKNISLVDFRKNSNPSLKCSVVKLDKDSSLCPIDNENSEYSVTNYDLSMMKKHHSKNKHEYVIPNDILNSDVIINLPKPKTHRKAGMTACMKNFVGIAGNKECIPHHRTGSTEKFGDEYPENSSLKNVHSFLKKYSYKKNIFINYARKACTFLLRRRKLLKYEEGSWYGNDTIWRTILDLNKLIIYSDKKGKMTSRKQRVIFNLTDMIISGEIDGPLLPTKKEVGYIMASFNQLNLDNCICEIMGFEPLKIKYLCEGYKLSKYSLAHTKNYKRFDNYGEVKTFDKYVNYFRPSNGWREYLQPVDKKDK